MGEYLLQQAAAGADAVQIFDSWAGLLSRASWEKLIRPHLTALLETVGRAGVPRILFLQNAPHLMDAYASLPAEVLGVDWRIDLPDLQAPLSAARRARQPRARDPDGRRRRPRAPRRSELLAATPPRGHIVNLGHGILPQTPLASVAALVEVVHSEEL